MTAPGGAPGDLEQQGRAEGEGGGRDRLFPHRSARPPLQAASHLTHARTLLFHRGDRRPRHGVAQLRRKHAPRGALRNEQVAALRRPVLEGEDVRRRSVAHVDEALALQQQGQQQRQKKDGDGQQDQAERRRRPAAPCVPAAAPIHMRGSSGGAVAAAPCAGRSSCPQSGTRGRPRRTGSRRRATQQAAAAARASGWAG